MNTVFPLLVHPNDRMSICHYIMEHGTTHKFVTNIFEYCITYGNQNIASRSPISNRGQRDRGGEKCVLRIQEVHIGRERGRDGSGANWIELGDRTGYTRLRGRRRCVERTWGRG